ncbi:tetratricopeptide repeat protein [Haloferula sp. BvORR071]|uniref:tetratricopeptide repeat protein n=1 Tax=Haloferula sp. BvORR071 TaxID=1396141 RepID=UPI00054CFE2C|nr:tetratricopeptide repeat protein [Haloferula sp. BvORR071]
MKSSSFLLACFVLASASTSLFAQTEATTPAAPTAVPATPADREIAKLRIMSRNPVCSPETWVQLGNALMQKSRDSVSHDFSEAYLAYRSALTLKPDHADAMCGMAWVKNSEHDFAAGKMWADKALATDPEQVDAHALIGDGAVELGNYEEAAKHYQIAIKQRPDLSSLSRGAHLLWITGDATRADALMQQAISAGGPYPENVAWCRAELALMHFNRGALIPAEQQAEKAMEAAPGNPRVLAVVARIAAAKKDYPKAIALYERSIAITPTHDALAPLVDLYRATGDAEKAEKQFEAVVSFHTAPHPHADGKMYPNPSLGANAQLARFYADQGKDLEDALKEARAAYERFKNVGTTDTLAWCLCLNGQAAEAKPIIKQAMRYRTQDAEMIFHAAMIHQALKEESTARQLFAKALNLNPDFNPAHAAKCAEMIAMPVASAEATAPKAGVSP